MYRTAPLPPIREPRVERDFIARLERMSAEQRLHCSRQFFTPHQRATWAARYPEEVPLVNGEFEWIALLAADRD